MWNWHDHLRGIEQERRATPTRPQSRGETRVSSGRGNSRGTTQDQRRARPSSAVGAGGNAANYRRAVQQHQRASGGSSRPGSASSAGGRFSAAAAARPGTANGANSGGADHGAPEVLARGLEQTRSGQQMARTNSLGNSGGPALPLYPSSANRPSRPRTPTARRGQSGSEEAATGEAAAAQGSHSRPDSANGFSSGTGSAPSQSNGGNLTTVISSALDYKRFLDRRKQMIQQQVETAQQASAARRGGQQAPEHDVSSEARVAEAASAGRDSTPLRRAETPGGDVDESNLEDAISPTAARAATSSPTSAQAKPPLAPSSASYSRANTPTRYTQSSGPPSGAMIGGGGNDLSQEAVTASTSVGRSATMRVSSLPAGGARQACRSAGQIAGEQPTEGDSTGQDEAQSMGAKASAGLAASAGAAAAQAAQRTQQRPRATSQDALARDSERPLTNGSVEDYVVGKQIGQGAYATVCFGLHKESNRKVAIKIYDKYKLMDPQRRKSVRSEIHLMERMRHPNVVIFHEALDTPKQIFLIMEYVGGGSLHHFLKKRPGRRLDDNLAKRIFFQVCQGIKYMHERHIVHRDVKLENLLLDEQGVVKIIDFGFSTVVPPGKKLKIFCGTPSYMSPEIVARKEYLGFCADIWAMGVLLYALLCGSFPFRGQNDRDLYRKIVRGVFSTPEFVGDGARSLLCRVLTTDMSRRPSVEDVLADHWLSNHKDELYSAKGSSVGYQPNSSTSSTATTAAPSSSTGQSARENISGDSSAPASRPHTSHGSHGVGAGGPRFGGSWTPHGAAGGSSAGAAPPPPAVPAGSGVAAVRAAAGGAQDLASGAGDSATGNTKEAAPGESQRPESRIQETGSGKRIEEEAISKLERLGYPRDEIVRQLKDESSHLCKLYHRFLKALTAWDKPGDKK